jgi:hypothetical protein
MCIAVGQSFYDSIGNILVGVNIDQYAYNLTIDSWSFATIATIGSGSANVVPTTGKKDEIVNAEEGHSFDASCSILVYSRSRLGTRHTCRPRGSDSAVPSSISRLVRRHELFRVSRHFIWRLLSLLQLEVLLILVPRECVEITPCADLWCNTGILTKPQFVSQHRASTQSLWWGPCCLVWWLWSWERT